MKQRFLVSRFVPIASSLVAAVACSGVASPPPVGTVAESVVNLTLWASPGGGGTACTQSSPCDLTQAQATVRQLNGGMTGDITVNLEDGTYALAAPWVFGPLDSGSNGHAVIWQAAAGATPVISGGTQITGWSQSSTPGVWQAQVGAGFATRQLYVDGVRMPRAGGKPTVGLTLNGDGFDTTTPTMATWRNPASIELEFSGAAVASGRGWTDSRCPIAAISATHIAMAQPCWGNLTNVGAPIDVFGTVRTVPTRIDNAAELLDEPGEWYVDRTSGTLSYLPLPGQSMASATVIAPTLETLLQATGSLDTPVHDVQFSGLTFAYATWLAPASPAGFAEMQANFTQTDPSADGTQGDGTRAPGDPYAGWTKTPANVTFRAVRNVTLRGDTFTHLGGAGLGFEYGSTGSIASGCVFTDISASGIQIGDTIDPSPADSRATVSNITVSNNYIHELPVEYLGGVGIFVGYTAKVALLNNQIDDTAYSGISIGWGGWIYQGQPGTVPVPNVSSGNVVADNHVFNVLQGLADGAPLYSNGARGPSLANGDRYSGNHFHDSWNDGHGVYDDIGSRFIAIDRQVVYGITGSSTWGGCFSYGDMTFENGFWSAPGNGWDCAAPRDITPHDTSAGSLAAANDVTLTAHGTAPFHDAARSCEDNAGCAQIVAAAGPVGAASAIVDGRGEIVLVDDQGPGFQWAPSPSAWTSETGSAYRELDRSRHYTTLDGASLSYTFGGTGVDYVAERNFDRGAVDIFVDGAHVGTADAHAQELVLHQTIFRVRGLAPGMHTLRAVKSGGTYMSVDAVRVYSGGSEGIWANDGDPAFAFTGDSWVSGANRGSGEYHDDLHRATADGDSYTFSFAGTGVDLVGDHDVDRGPFDVDVDGSFVQSVSAEGSFAAQQLLFSVRGLAQGSHTARATKRGGAVMDVDRAVVYGSALVNDDDPSVAYSGACWVDSTGRPWGDYQADVHFTTCDGDRATLSFTGSGVDVITERNLDRGIMDVVVDGVARGSVFTYQKTLATQQTVYRLHGLARGAHQLSLTMHGGRYMAIDAFSVEE